MLSEGKCQCGQVHGACTTEFQYAVKVVCGRVTVTPASASTPVAPGQYWTAINIHNPDKCREAHLRWKVAVASPGRPGPVSAYSRTLVLGPDMALEIDCPQIRQVVQPLFPPPPPTFVKGYVVIECDIEVDVVAVYSGTQSANLLLTTFHTERVQPRCVPVCEDLILPVHTGFAAWQTVAPTVGQLGPVVAVNPFPQPPNWAAPPFGSQWVSQAITDGTSASLATRHYELCFDLCFGYTVPPPFQIQVLADDSARVFLNGTLPANFVGQVGPPSGGGGFQSPTTLTVNPSLLRPGRNCFRIQVTNGPPPVGGGPTAFALGGILRVARGKCPCAPLPLLPPSRGPLGPADSDTTGGSTVARKPRRKSGAAKSSRKKNKR